MELKEFEIVKSPERCAFENWYIKNAFDYEQNPIGSRDCSLQWAAWQAAINTTHLNPPPATPEPTKFRMERHDGW